MPPSSSPSIVEPSTGTSAIAAGLALLGIERLVLAIHDASFPSAPDEDLGRGSPYGREARGLLTFVRELGFNGVQLGPQGATSLANPSPYDGALFTKSLLAVAPATLIEDPDWAPLATDLLAPHVDALPPGPTSRTRYAHAWHATRALVAELHARFTATAPAVLASRFRAFVEANGGRLAADGLFEALTDVHGTDDWQRWPDVEAGADVDAPAASLDRRLLAPPAGLGELARQRQAALAISSAEVIERHLFGQFILDEQHRALRRTLTEPAGLRLYGDLQIGFSHRDVWSRRGLFWADYLMGAPPSRTNPDGQAWGFAVLDPAQVFRAAVPHAADASAAGQRAPGPVLELLLSRIDRALVEFDGLRVDHPHGWVCPWVYDAHAPDPQAAVARGARLFCSPNLPDHPALAPLAIVEADQLTRDPGLPRYADDWVRTLREDQVTRYAVLFDALMARVQAAGRQPSDVVCEVLSTWPRPLRRVMARHGLGRFVVTQKADLARPDDVYRGENASEHDWIMVGNHDTRPLCSLVLDWHGSAAGIARASYLGGRLMPVPSLQPRFARWVAADPAHLFQAMMAELFTTRARRISVFFADLFGLPDTYNRPGIVDAANWTLRLPPDWREVYRVSAARGLALNVPLALALALTAGSGRTGAAIIDRGGTIRSTIGRLLEAARAFTPAPDDELHAILAAVESARA
jgi:4-alpha-glucanotransferase